MLTKTENHGKLIFEFCCIPLLFSNSEGLDNMRQYASIYRVILYINYFFNAIFCTLCPPILAAIAGQYLTDRYHWNRGFIFLFVIAGLVIGVFSGISFLRKTVRIFQRSDTDTQSPFRIDKTKDESTDNHTQKKKNEWR